LASYWDIERAARRVNDAAYQLRKRHETFSREIHGLDSWWQGEASKVFKAEYQEISFEINRILNLMSDLENRLRRLSYEVKRAEEERRRRLEEQRMAQSR